MRIEEKLLKSLIHTHSNRINQKDVLVLMLFFHPTEFFSLPEDYWEECKREEFFYELTNRDLLKLKNSDFIVVSITYTHYENEWDAETVIILPEYNNVLDSYLFISNVHVLTSGQDGKIVHIISHQIEDANFYEEEDSLTANFLIRLSKDDDSFRFDDNHHII